MSGSEQDLRIALRQLCDSPPEVTDLVGRVERRARQRRNRGIAATAVVAILAVLGVVLALGMPDRGADRTPATNSSKELADAKMQYAAFVAWWDGYFFVGSGTDTGVVGTTITFTNPPLACAIAGMAEGQPKGTQSAWVLGTRVIFGGEGAPAFTPSVTGVLILWPTGVTNCDGPAPGETLVYGLIDSLRAAPIAYAQTFADPSQPALDVAGVYNSIPQEQLTAHGREVFASYEKAVGEIAFGSPKDQTYRALLSLADWIGVGAARSELNQESPQTGPAELSLGTEDSILRLPEGFSARWTDAGAFCVDGSVATSPVLHIDSDAQIDEGHVVAPGPCP